MMNNKLKSLRDSQENGIYYFLGNIPQHINHALPLYELVGGTVVVASKIAENFLKPYNIKTLLVNDEPELFLDLDAKLTKTFEYLNANAKVIFVYDTFTLKNLSFTVPVIMLSHGLALKDYWVDWKIDTVKNNYTHITSLGSFSKQQLIEKGLPKEMFIDAALARNDLIINSVAKYSKKDFLKQLPGYKGQKIISYIPTYWGETSVFDTGIEILENISDDYYLIFKPHPQTPWDSIKQYQDIVSSRNNIHFFPEHEVDLLSIYKYSSAFICDMSSVIADIALIDKPIIFAYGGSDNQQDKNLYWPIREIQTTSFSISASQGDCTNLVIAAALQNNSTARKQAYKIVKERLFYDLNGNTRKTIINYIIQNFNV